MLADSLTDVEVARASVHAAAVGIDEGESDMALARAVAGARILASRAAQRGARTCVQVHGGMGYTWELDAHLYLKRALVLDTHFDSPRVCGNHGRQPVALGVHPAILYYVCGRGFRLDRAGTKGLQP